MSRRITQRELRNESGRIMRALDKETVSRFQTADEQTRRYRDGVLPQSAAVLDWMRLRMCPYSLRLW